MILRISLFSSTMCRIGSWYYCLLTFIHTFHDPFKQCSFGLSVSLELPKVQPRLPLVSTDCTIRLQICLQTKPDTFSLGSFCNKAQGPVKLHSFPGKGLANHFKLGLKKLSRTGIPVKMIKLIKFLPYCKI